MLNQKWRKCTKNHFNNPEYERGRKLPSLRDIKHGAVGVNPRQSIAHPSACSCETSDDLVGNLPSLVRCDPFRSTACPVFDVGNCE